MKGLKSIEFPSTLRYDSNSEFTPYEFFYFAFCNSTTANLLLGYFSFSALRSIALGFASFISREGKLRIVANTEISLPDLELIRYANSDSGIINISNIHDAAKKMDTFGIHFFDCLAWLIRKNRIEIKFIKPEETRGISHYKTGIFEDESNKISFNGSCNFTASGLLENLEMIQVETSWGSESENSRIEEDLNKFNLYFQEKATGVKYVEMEELEGKILSAFGSKSLEDLLRQEERLIRNLLIQSSSVKRNLRIERVRDRLISEINSPRFPFASGPREYQVEAYEKWASNNYRGIFSMATGTGKTVTSLLCLLELYKLANCYRAVIVVPTISLIHQWHDECKKFGFINVYHKALSSNLLRDIDTLAESIKYTNESYILIMTYDAFSSRKIQSRLQNLDSHSLLIADEAHNLGSESRRSLLVNFPLERRIGLSATIHRQFDKVGDEALFDFFDDRPPFSVSLSMKDALDAGWLCQYKYFPHIVRLTSTEMEKYNTISLELMKFFDTKKKEFRKNENVKFLLLERKRIIHKAKNKENKFREIINKIYQDEGSLSYTLVYAPEGEDESDGQRHKSKSIINRFTRIIRDVDSEIMVRQFTGKTRERDQILAEFSAGGIDVLTSMKCLDEGIDVPRAETAIFCSSTGNPRQFIQRRGRVLRNHTHKNIANIHDLVVVPESSGDSGSYSMEKSLFKNELQRVKDFSLLSVNETYSFQVLEEILDYYNLSMY